MATPKTSRRDSNSRHNLRISRPRFWPYLVGPFIIGIAAGFSSGAGVAQIPGLNWWLLALGLFFTYPANFVIYGINDVNDYETDKLNPKKQGYEALLKPEQRWLVQRQALSWVILGYLLLEFVPGDNDVAGWGMLGFFLFGVLYSMPPVRAKTKPLLDSMFNVLYVFPAVVGYGLVTGQMPAWQLFVAAMLWCMAMHAYSAVPDIAADTKAKISTIATTLGARNTLLFCIVCYALAAYLSSAWLGWFSWLAGSVYLAMMLLTISQPGRDHVFKLYQYFPYINMAVGAGLFLVIVSR